MTSKPPAFQFYAKDWLTDERVLTMSLAARGLYIHAMSLAWLHGGSVPADPTTLSRLLGVSREEFDLVWPEVSPCWNKEKNRWVLRRLRRAFAAYQTRSRSASDAGKSGAAKRWGSQAKVSPSQNDSSSSASASASAVSLPGVSASASLSRTAGKPGEPGGKKPAGPHQRLVSLFHEAYKIQTGGKKPTWNGAQTSTVKRLLKGHGEDEVSARMRRFFEYQVPSYVWKDGTPDLLSFARHFDEIPESKATKKSSLDDLLDRI